MSICNKLDEIATLPSEARNDIGEDLHAALYAFRLLFFFFGLNL